MLSCKRAGELMTRSMETELTRWERLALAFHLFACKWCRRFRRQIQFVHRACQDWSRFDRLTEAAAEATLSERARARIRLALREASPEEPTA